MEDLASERGCLAGVIQYGADAYIEISDLLGENNTLCDEYNQYTWSGISNIFEKDASAKFDFSTFQASMREIGLDGILQDKEYIKYLKALKNYFVELSNLRKLAGNVAKCKVIRDLEKTLETANHRLSGLTGTEDIDTIISSVESPILDYTTSLSVAYSNDYRLISDGMGEYFEHLGTNPRDMAGISTGFPEYDNAIGGGLQRKDVNFIAARMKIGKSSLADNISIHIAMNLGIPVLQIDTEMSQERHQIRIGANLSAIDMNEIKTGKYYKNVVKRKKLQDAVDKFKNAPFYYKNIAGMDYNEVLSFIKRWIIQKVGFDENGRTKDCVLIYDYFKLCDSSAIGKNMMETQVLGFQLQELINLVIKMDISALSFVQQNRQGVEDDTSDTIAGSDRIGMFCGSMAIFQKKTPEEIAEDGPEYGNRKMKVIFCRDGEGTESNNWINMNFNGKINRIRELGLRSNKNIKAKDDDETFATDEEF